MPRPFRTVLTLVAIALGVSPPVPGQPIPIPAEDATPDEPPESVLAGKGLVRVGNAYILKDTPGRDSKLRELAITAETIDAQFKPLLDELNRLRRVSETLPRAAQRSQARNVLRAFENENKANIDRYPTESTRVNNGIQLLIAETRKIYETIGNEPPVKRAFRAYNRGHRPKIVLGPVASEAEYRAAILRDDAALLRERGMIQEKGSRWVVEPEARVGSLAFRARNQLQHLGVVEAAVEAGNPSKLLEKRKAAAERLAEAPEPRRRQLAAEVELLDAQVRRHSPRDPGMVAAWREGADHLAGARRAFLDAVAELRRAADAAPAARRELEADGEVLDTLEELAGRPSPRAATRSHPIAEALEYRRGLATLAALEAAIRVERLPLDRGSGGPGLVPVTFNGSDAVKAAIDPAAATTRLPSPLASAVGASPGPGAATADVLLPGGQTVRGRVSVLRSLTVGPVTVEHVPCVVLPDDAAGPLSPVLGVDLLARIGGETDEDGASLLITRVTPPPHKAAAPPAAGRP
ncbi:MAG: aspartyl protease family protein [Planctomycetia bacterium]|nr:aspartyl protease family protein [Planctomycetia bacterium]